MAAKIDTSGVVAAVESVKHPSGPTTRVVHHFDDLDPFTQGAVEAALREINHKWRTSLVKALAFSDIAPETLARIMEDCEEALLSFHAGGGRVAEDGRLFWQDRQHGNWPKWPPLRLYLAYDGKVRIAEDGR